LAGLLQQRIAGAGAGTFHGTDQFEDILLGSRLEQQMQVIGHDHGAVQIETDIIGLRYGVHDVATHLGAAQGAASHACIEPSVHALGKTRVVIFRVGE
jgi:hypothetical protein